MKKLILMTGVLAAAACGTETTETAPTPMPAPSKSTAELAEEKFWETFYAGEYSKLPEAIELLERAYDENPNDARNTFLLAHANFWGLGEIDRDPAATPEKDQQYVMKAYRYFKEAAALNPDDLRINGWVGGLGMGIAAATGDQGMMAESRGLIEAGKQQFPQFYNFIDAIILGDQPVDSPPFQGAVESSWAALAACLGEELDRDNPTYVPHMSKRTNTGQKAICWNGQYAPHGFEGVQLFLGDLQVKAGNIAAARVFYENAKLADEYPMWRFKSHLEGRLLMDLEARSALYRDDNPDNDPALGVDPEGCGGCHGR